MSPRLASGIWVQAYLQRLRLADIPVYVTRKGDAMAGAVVVKVALLDGNARAYERGFDLMSGARLWHEIAAGPEPEVDAQLSRAAGRDPDLWILELESRDGRTLLEEEGLRD